MADGDLYQIPTSPDTPHPLGRSIVHHDVRNRQFRALTATPSGAPRSRPWSRRTPPFDQIDSNCTTEAAVGLLRTQPHTRRFGFYDWPGFDEEAERVAFYRESQQHDPWAGPPPAYDGTSTDAPFRLMRERGVIEGWRWLFGVEELREHLWFHGAAVVGTLWLRSMFQVDRKGYIQVDTASPVDGGHAYEVVYCNPRSKDFTIVNSWGENWGRGGRAKLRFDEMGWLLEQNGEAVTVPA